MYGGDYIFCERDGLRDGMHGPTVLYLTAEQNQRLEKIRRHRLLWKGKHRQYFLLEARTQFNFDKLRAQGVVIAPYMSINLLRLISTTFADLLLGKDPKYTSEDPDEQETIEDLSKRSDINRVFYDAVVQSSWSGEAMVEVCIYGGEIYLENRKPDEIFPIGERNPDGQYSQYDRYAEATLADKSKLLLVTTYTAGLIERHCYQLSDKGQKGAEVQLDQWPVKGSNQSALQAMEKTGIDVPTIVWLGNEMDEGQPTSDYTDDLIECQDHLNAAETQLAVVIAKHGNPKMYMTPQNVNPQTGGVESAMGVFYVRNKDEAPGYITWNAELSSAMENKNARMMTMATISELTPGLLGIPKGAAPESAEKLRLDCTKPLARVARKAKYVGPFIRTALDTARALESHTKYVVIEESPSLVTFRDPMPVDMLAMSQTVANLHSANGISIEDSVAMRIEDPNEAAEEVARIKKQVAAAVPPILMGGGGAEPGEEPGAMPNAEGQMPNDQTNNAEGNASATGDGSPESASMKAA